MECQSAITHLRTVDSRLRTMELFSELWLRLTNLISTVKAQWFISDAIRREWESRIFCHWMKGRGCTRISCFSLAFVMEGSSFLVHYFYAFYFLTHISSQPYGSACFIYFPIFLFLLYIAAFLGYKYCIK